MRSILITLLFFAFSTLSIDGQTRRATKKAVRPKPVGSMTEAPPKAAPALEVSLGATVEKYVSSYEINSDGTAKETRELQKRCHTEACIQRYGSFTQIFNGDQQKVKLLNAVILKANGTEIKVSPAAIFDRPTAQGEAAPGFSSLRELEIKFADFKVGDAYNIKYEILTTKPTFERKFDSLEFFSLLFDWKSIEVNVTAPSDYPLFTEATGLDGGKISDTGGMSRWQYRKTNLSKINFEPGMFDVTDISPKFAVTTFRNPEELGSAFWEGFRQKAVITPELQALADRITKDITLPRQQASAIYDWVNKNIRYLSIVLDRGGWIPHSSTEIVKNGYGDCKDYTALIHTLLKAKGIDSIPVLIRSDLGDWFPSVPTADYFNHAILYIPSLDLFADATMPNTRLGLIPQTIVGKRAVLAGERSGIIQVPKDNPADNQIISEVVFTFRENGSVRAKTRNTYVGRTEILFRPMFSDSSIQRDPSVVIRVMLAYFGIDGDGKITHIGNPHEVGEPFKVELEAGIENYTTFLPKGRVELPVGLNMINLGEMEMFSRADSRKTGILVGATRFMEDISIELPTTVKVTGPPAAVSFSNAIGSIKIASESKEGRLRVTREFIISKDTVGPKDYPAFKDLIKKLGEVNIIGIDYTADSALLKAKSKELRASPRKSTTAPTIYDVISKELGSFDPTPLTAATVRGLEKKLIADPNDVSTRKRLMRHYSGMFGRRKRTVAEETAHVAHTLWLVRNRPDIGEEDVYGWGTPPYSPASVEQLKSAWIAEVEKAKQNSRVRLNAISFFRDRVPAIAEKLLEDGKILEPTNYKYPLLAVELKRASAKSNPAGKQRTAILLNILEQGKAALSLIKTERSEERDRDRNELLKHLCSAAIEAGEFDSAATYARELILDFGQSAADLGYDEAAHVGNNTLGLVELQRGNVGKAGEFLLTSIRAPLRKEYNSLSKIEVELAKGLFEKGEKAVVLEYLGYCLELGNLKAYPESHATEIKALTLWREQIKKGADPSFDFDSP